MYTPCGPKTTLYSISTDQTLNMWWSTPTGTLVHKFTIKFLTSELESIFYSEADPNTLFFLLKDSFIRSVAPLSKSKWFLAEYWRHARKYKIVKAVAHPYEQGIVCMLTSCNKVIVYDLFDDRLCKIF